MPAPAIAAAVAAGATAQLVVGLLNYYQAEKARKASQRKLDEIRRTFEAIVPPEFDVSIEDDPDFAFEKLNVPEFQSRPLPKEAYRVIDKYEPEIAPFVAERAPELVQATAAGEQGLAAQREALNRYRQIASSGYDPILAQQLMEAQRAAQAQAESRQQNVMQDFARRGQLGSGIQAAQELGAGAGAMEDLSRASYRAAAEQYANQLRALGSSAELGGSIRGQDINEQTRNTDILNRFNRESSAAYRDYLTRSAQLKNEAQLRNLEERQRISDLEAGRARSDRIYGNQLASQRYNAQAAERDKALANRLGIRQYADQLKQRDFENQMARAKGMSGGDIASAEYRTKAQQARNQANQAIGDVLASGVAAGAYTYNSPNAGDGKKQQGPGPEPESDPYNPYEPWYPPMKRRKDPWEP